VRCKAFGDTAIVDDKGRALRRQRTRPQLPKPWNPGHRPPSVAPGGGQSQQAPAAASGAQTAAFTLDLTPTIRPSRRVGPERNPGTGGRVPDARRR